MNEGKEQDTKYKGGQMYTLKDGKCIKKVKNTCYIKDGQAEEG